MMSQWKEAAVWSFGTETSQVQSEVFQRRHESLNHKLVWEVVMVFVRRRETSPRPARSARLDMVTRG